MLIEMMTLAVEQEVKWSKHIIAWSIIGMSDINIENYTKYLANQRLILLWITPMYPEIISNPFKHLDRLQDNNSEKWNFFESTVTNYTQSSSMKWGWDF
jgi:ribonucleoside-diphosphate reductase beta chain